MDLWRPGCRNVTQEKPRSPYANIRAQVRTTLSLNLGTLAEAEEILIRNAMDSVGGNLRLAAERLGIARGTLYSKISKYDIKRQDE